MTDRRPLGRRLLRLRAALKRSRALLSLLALWLVCGALFFRFGRELSWTDAWLTAFYFEVQPDAPGQGYAFWGQSLLFGVFVALLLRDTLENYAERCRLMAGLVTEHTIIVGYTHLGKRLVDHCLAQGMPYVLIEKDRALVDDLLRKGEPVVVDDARSADALHAANIAGARRLIVASNNMETALIVTKEAREANPACKIAVRCPLDELAGVLEKLGADHVYSASLAAFKELTALMR